MNERIKELYKQSFDYPGLLDCDKEFNPEKFAELLVLEFADYIDAFNRKNMVEEGISGDMLKQHFGVE